MDSCTSCTSDREAVTMSCVRGEVAQDLRAVATCLITEVYACPDLGR